MKLPQQQFFVIAHNIRSLFNVGSIFRSGDAFGVSKIYLTGYTPTPALEKHRIKISKTALGAEESVEWAENKSAVKVIKDLRLNIKGIQIIALENHVPVGAGFSRPQTINKYRPKFPVALILGEEVGGVDNRILKLCDKIVEIPMFGQKESLNVSVAFGVAAFYIATKPKL